MEPLYSKAEIVVHCVFGLFFALCLCGIVYLAASMQMQSNEIKANILIAAVQAAKENAKGDVQKTDVQGVSSADSVKFEVLSKAKDEEQESPYFYVTLGSSKKESQVITVSAEMYSDVRTGALLEFPLGSDGEPIYRFYEKVSD